MGIVTAGAQSSVPAFDIAIIGGGIAGAGLAFELATNPYAAGKRILLLEQEPAPGMHTTGRSAALYTQAYGNADIRALTVASKVFFDTPPPGFTGHPLLGPRGVLLVGRDDQRAAVEAEAERAQKLTPRVRLIGPEEAQRLSPALRPDYIAAACYEPDAMDMDVDAILQGYLAGAKAKGVDIWLNAGVLDMTERAAGWRLNTAQGAVDAGIVVNAAGAWATGIAHMAGAQAIEITPKRRTAFLVKPPEIEGFAQSAATIDIDEQFYFKPDAGLVLISPGDETPVPAHDVQAEEIDVAIGADRVQRAANIVVRKVEHSRAGLRNFAADKTPVVGFDDQAPGFFWLAGQGGYGIQTAPAMSMLAAALILGQALPEPLAATGVAATRLSPTRF